MPGNTCLSLNRIAIMPAIGVFDSSTMDHPGESNSTAATEVKIETTGPYLTPKGLEATSWNPPILSFQNTATGYVNSDIIGILFGVATVVIFQAVYAVGPIVSERCMMKRVA